MKKEKANPITSLRIEIVALKARADFDSRTMEVQRAKIELLERLVLKLGGCKGATY